MSINSEIINSLINYNVRGRFLKLILFLQSRYFYILKFRFVYIFLNVYLYITIICLSFSLNILYVSIIFTLQDEEPDNTII